MPFKTRPELTGTFGMVASTHWLASQVGMAMLERGGNAFDAAVAAGFTLQVVEPHLNGPAGDLPILLHHAKTGQTRVICGQGPAPAGATIAHYRDHLGLDRVPGTGYLATVVPGAFDAWCLMLRDYGTLPLAEVLEPAIYYAETGFPVLERIAAALHGVEDLFRDHWPGSAAIWLDQGAAPRAGDIWRLPALAETYQRLAREADMAPNRDAGIDAARRAWSQGFVAEAIDRHLRDHEALDVSGRAHKGVLTGADMAGFEAQYEEPLRYTYHGHTVCKTGPWGQGPVFLQQLALLDGFDVSRMDPTGPDFIHLVTESAKLAFADRDAYYGDPADGQVPIAALMSRSYSLFRRRLIDMDQASLLLRPGVLGEAPPVIPIYDSTGVREGPLTAAFSGAGEPTVRGDIGTGDELRAQGGDTCHVDVVDRRGNLVSATPSGGWLQSSPGIPDLGFCLNTRAQMFWLRDGLPSSLAPGRRPRTTLTPTLVERDGRGTVALGTPGGDSQDQWSLTLFLRRVHHTSDWQENIDLPMFHTTHMPSSFWPRETELGVLKVESRLPQVTVQELARRGHVIVDAGPWSLGRLSAVERLETRAGPVLKAGANPRGAQGYAVGR